MNNVMVISYYRLFTFSSFFIIEKILNQQNKDEDIVKLIDGQTGNVNGGNAASSSNGQTRQRLKAPRRKESGIVDNIELQNPNVV